MGHDSARSVPECGARVAARPGTGRRRRPVGCGAARPVRIAGRRRPDDHHRPTGPKRRRLSHQGPGGRRRQLRLGEEDGALAPARALVEMRGRPRQSPTTISQPMTRRWTFSGSRDHRPHRPDPQRVPACCSTAAPRRLGARRPTEPPSELAAHVELLTSAWEAVSARGAVRHAASTRSGQGTDRGRRAEPSQTLAAGLLDRLYLDDCSDFGWDGIPGVRFTARSARGCADRFGAPVHAGPRHLHRFDFAAARQDSAGNPPAGPGYRDAQP